MPERADALWNRGGGCSVADLLWADDATPWGIEFCPGPDGNYWQNQWRVGREGGEGETIAVFEFPDHAEAFVSTFGPAHMSADDDPNSVHLGPVPDVGRGRTEADPADVEASS